MRDETTAVPGDDAIRAYVVAHFWPRDRLATACGASEDEVEAMIGAGCAPGIIYALDDKGWWSALGGYRSGAEGRPGDSAERYYSAGAVWSLRAARLVHRAGASLAEAAADNRARFQAEFAGALRAVVEAPIAFPDCFEADGSVDRAAADAQAAQEWAGWLAGGYAVCLRIFNAATCVTKESLRATLKRHIADPARYPIDDGDILALCERLAQPMLSFAPWERPVGTPGMTIDRLLRYLSLGCELPYPAGMPD